MSEKRDPLFIAGTAFWTKIAEPQLNDRNEEEYVMDVSVKDAATKKVLQDAGIKLKNKDAQLVEKGQAKQGDFVTCKSKYRPTVIDSDKNELPSNTLIGNGSKVIVKATPYTWNFKGKSGVSLGLTAVQVIDLVEYSKDVLSGFETKTEGYKVGTKVNAPEQASEQVPDDECPF